VQILPSDAGRLELEPFRGVRYAPERVSGLAEVTSPPYDVIFRDSEDQLMAADPHNVVRLILPRPDYQHAAKTLHAWLDEGVLVTDPEPALYVYEQSSAGAVIQRGVIGALRLVPPEAGIVLPHENVSPGPVAGRLALMEATQANLEPIFLLYSGSPGATARIIAGAIGAEPLLDAEADDGLRHRLWATTDPADLAAIGTDLAPRQALIADGHHRYAAYRKLQRRHGGPGPWDYGLALLVDSSAYPPHIGAIHRVVGGLDVQHAVKLAAAAFEVRPLPGADVPEAAAKLAGPAFILAGDGHAYVLSDPDERQLRDAMPPGTSAAWQALPAAILQELLITKLWELTDDDATVRVVHHDAGAAVQMARQTAGTAVLCGPMSPEDVYAVAARGEKVPRKSTSFAPKPRTGLVLRTF
jgi:uncharacterized protein (DUF1015 family)